jgi:hypothetical protein
MDGYAWKTAGEIGSFVAVFGLPWSLKNCGCSVNGSVYLFAHGPQKAMGAFWAIRLNDKFYCNGFCTKSAK